VDQEHRNKRLRLLVAKLNRERKKQAKKIDILCNDLIAAQREFIKSLDATSFAASFYESIVGITDLTTLLYTADKLIQEEIPDANVVFFLRQSESFELHMFETDRPVILERQELKSCFIWELADNICKSNRICTLADMFGMGLEGNPAKLNKISGAAVPLGQFGSSVGFIFIYRSSQNELTVDELRAVTAVRCGLSRAIQSCRVLSHSAD